MEKRIRKVSITLFLIAVILMPFFAYNTAYGESDKSYGYTTERFITQVEAEGDHNFLVTENITIDFQAAHHTIFRRIPYDPQKNRIKDIEVPGEDFSVHSNTSGEKVFCVIQIGNGKKEMKGKHTYTIKYRIKNFRDGNHSADFIDLWLIPSEWETPIEHAEGTLVMPKETNWNKAHFLKGRYGDKVHKVGKSVATYADGKKVAVSTENLKESTGILLQNTLPQGYWSNVPKYRSPGFFGAIFFTGAAAFSLILYLLFGKRPEKTERRECFPPEDFIPAEIAYIVDGTVSDGDLSAMIYRFANKGYLDIRKETDSGYRLIKLKELPEDEDLFSKRFFDTLFKNGRESVRTKSMYVDFIKEADECKKIIFEKRKKGKSKNVYTLKSRLAKLFAVLGLVGALMGTELIMFNEGGYRKANLMIGVVIILLGIYFTLNSFTQLVDRFFLSRFINKMGKVAIGSMAAVLTSMFIFKTGRDLFGTPAYSIIMICGIWVCVTACIFMKTVKPEIIKQRERIIGFRNFLETGEREDFEKVSDNTEEYFKEMLPYAFVFGVSQRVIEIFKDYADKDYWDMMETIKWDFRGLRTVKNLKKPRKKQKKQKRT